MLNVIGDPQRSAVLDGSTRAGGSWTAHFTRRSTIELTQAGGAFQTLPVVLSSDGIALMLAVMPTIPARWFRNGDASKLALMLLHRLTLIGVRRRW